MAVSAARGTALALLRCMKRPDPHPAAARDYLAPIKGYASLIQDDNPEGTNTRWWADKIVRDVTALEQHIGDLDMLRLDEVPQARTTWRAVIANAIEACRGISGDTRIEVFNEAVTPFVSRGDLLSRALFQVLRNACEAAGPEGWVRVRCTERIAGNDGALDADLTVEDGGPGIPRDQIERVSRPFVTTRAGHLGLGLSYVEAVARVIAMGVRIESGVAGGTTVTMRLRIQGGQW